MKELETPEVFEDNRSCDGNTHWTEILIYGKCHQCGLGYQSNEKYYGK